MNAPEARGFAALGVPSDLCRLLEASGITDPFPIQSAVIADALAGHDVVGRAPTGSGKTLGFGIPAVVGLTKAAPRRPTALVLAPTRELAEQIATELRPLARRRGHTVTAVYGGMAYGPQRKALSAGASLVVACPGRLEDLLQMGAISLNDVRHVVIDEADRMADMGFMPSVRRILALCPADRQVQLFSATLDAPVSKLISEFQRSPRRHEVGPAGPDVHAAHHVFWSSEREERVQHTAAAIRRLGPTMVFTRTRHGADRLAKQLERLGVSAAAIHGGRTQPQRAKALQSFAKGTVQSLIATDVAARGVHVDGVAGVLHYDPPADASTYVHRSGRTARAGSTGTVVSLVDRANAKPVRRMLEPIGVVANVARVDVNDLAPSVTTPLVAAASVAAAPTGAVVAIPVSDERRRGVVTFANTTRGFAFIDGGDGKDLFAHHTKFAEWPIEVGQPVGFATAPGRKGVEAIDISALEPTG